MSALSGRSISVPVRDSAVIVLPKHFQHTTVFWTSTNHSKIKCWMLPRSATTWPRCWWPTSSSSPPTSWSCKTSALWRQSSRATSSYSRDMPTHRSYYISDDFVRIKTGFIASNFNETRPEVLYRVFPGDLQKRNWKIDTSLGAIEAQNLFFLTLKLGGKFSMDKRSI